MSQQCEHVWRFQHTVWWPGRDLAGSSASERMLGDLYYCEKCLARRIANERVHGTTYSPKIEGVLPR